MELDFQLTLHKLFTFKLENHGTQSLLKANVFASFHTMITMLLIDSGRYRDYEKRQTYLFSQCWKGVVNEAIPQLCILQGSTYLLRYFQMLILLVTGVLKRESQTDGERAVGRGKKRRRRRTWWAMMIGAFLRQNLKKSS